MTLLEDRLVYHRHQVDTDLMQLLMCVELGSSNDISRHYGLAHFIEHVVVRSRLSNLQGIKAVTGRDRTTFSITVKAKDFEAVFDLFVGVMEPLADILPTLVPEERSLIRQEILERNDTLSWRIKESALATAWKGTAYAHDSLGSLWSIERIDAELLARTHRSSYVPSRIVLVIVGPDGSRFCPEIADPGLMDTLIRPSAPLPRLPRLAELDVAGSAGPLTLCYWHEQHPHALLPPLVRQHGGVRLMYTPVADGWLAWAICSGNRNLADVMLDRLATLGQLVADSNVEDDEAIYSAYMKEMRRSESVANIAERVMDELWTGCRLDTGMATLGASIRSMQRNLMDLVM